jgi:predicted amidophosphoribosyltransferase
VIEEEHNLICPVCWSLMTQYHGDTWICENCEVAVEVEVQEDDEEGS